MPPKKSLPRRMESPINTKRFKQPSSFERLKNSIPDRLKKGLDLIAENFIDSRVRNLPIMHTKDQSLYAQMTHYEGHNFCWIQPTLVPNKNLVDAEYDKYIRRANQRGRSGKLEPIEEIRVGVDCLAQYEVDDKWYRAIVVDEPQTRDQHWLLLFVDYGNFQLTKPDRMAIPLNEPEGCHYFAPLQAICCRIYNVVARLPIYRDEIDARFEQFFAQNVNNFMNVKVREVRSDFIVDCDLFLPDPLSKLVGDDKLYRHHIGQGMIDENMAFFEDPVAAYAIKQ